MAVQKAKEKVVKLRILDFSIATWTALRLRPQNAHRNPFRALQIDIRSVLKGGSAWRSGSNRILHEIILIRSVRPGQ